MEKLFTLLLTLATALCNAQTFAYSFGDVNSDYGYSIAVDASANVYTTGYFAGTVDFDPGPGVVNLATGSTSITNIFILKLDAAGNFVWAKNMGALSVSNSLAVDATGNVYITGLLYGTGDFDPGAGVVNLVSTGSSDIFILKLDASGNFAWAKSMGGISTSVEAGNSIAADASGNVYITGSFMSNVDFDPGAGSFILSSANAASSDVFVLKLNTAGNFVWAGRMGGTNTDVGNSIAVDASGNVYTTGGYSVTADFDPTVTTFNLLSAGGRDIFVSKLDASGSFIWAKSMGGTGNDVGLSIAVDASGNVHTTGYFVNTVDFNPGAGTANLASSGSGIDIFVSKLDVSGNYLWAKDTNGFFGGQGNSIALDAVGNVYTTGAYTSNGFLDFDPGAGTFYLSSFGAFILKLNTSGNFVKAKKLDGTAGGDGKSIAVDATGNAYITGNFVGTGDFDPDAGTITLTSAGANDVFISKINSLTLLPLHLISFSGVAVNNINTLQWKTADEINTKEFVLETSTDGRSFIAIAAIAAKGFGNGVYAYNDANVFTSKLYYRLKMVDMDGKFNYSNIIYLTGQQNNKIAVYPNPTIDLITIKTGGNKLQNTQMNLTDLTGKILYSKIITSPFEILNVKTLPKGMYLINFADGSVQKLIKE